MRPPDEQIEHMLLQVRDKGYPEPNIYENEWQHYKSLCPICGKDTLITGYVRHFFLVHTPEGFAHLQRMLAKRRR